MLIPTPKNCDVSVKKAIQLLSTKLDYDSKPTFAGLTLTDGPLNLSGKMVVGSFGSPIDVTATRQYGFEIHYSGNDYDVTGIRSRAQLITTDTTATAQGALLQAANNNGIDVGVLNGALIEAIGKSDANAATISTMRACLVNTEWGDYDTVTNLKTLHIRTHSRNAAGAGSFGTGYGIYIENEAVGGNGQAWDAGIYFKDTNLSAGNKAFTYGIDFSGGTFASEEIKLANGSVIGSDKVTFAPTTDSTTFFQIKNAVGTIVGNFDTTNIRFGVGTDSPSLKFDVKGSPNTTFDNCPLLMQVHTIDAYADGMGGGISLGGRYDATRTTTFGYIAGVKDGAANGDTAGKLILGARPTGGGGVDMMAITILGTGNIGIGEEAPETLTEWTSTAPYLTLHNSTEEDLDDGRESRIIFKGEQSGGEETTLAMIEVGHDGTGNDRKGYLDISINDGDDDDDSLTHVVTINLAGNPLAPIRFGIGTADPNAPLEVKGLYPGSVGNFASGLLQVRTADNSENANAVITGHNSYTTPPGYPTKDVGNTQLWYLGSTSQDNSDIAFINRRYGDLFFKTNDIKRLTITKDGDIGVNVTDPHSKLEVNGAISSATSAFSTAGPTDDVDVSGINTLFVDTSSNTVTIGGFANGVDGQILYVIRTSNVNNVVIEHNKTGATQKIFLHKGSDETLGTVYGGWVFVCHGGTDWHDASHAKHVP